MEAHRHQPMVSRHLSSKDCMSATLIDCEKKWNTLMMWLASWHEICLSAAANPLIQGWCSLEKANGGCFFRLWTVFLSSGLFVGLPSTGWSGRAAIQTGVLHTLERSNTAMSLQMQCRTVSLRTGRLVLAYLFHLSIILMHTISIHWCMTALKANVIGQAGWKRLQMWSLSLNKSYIFHHHQQRQHFALTITYSRMCASRTFIPPQSFRILHPLF